MATEKPPGAEANHVRLAAMLVLLVLYFLHDIVLRFWFRAKFRKEDDFLGQRAPGDIQKFFGRAVYLVMLYYLIVLSALWTGFDFWGFVSEIRPLSNSQVLVVAFLLSLTSLALMVAARLNLGSSWRVGLDHRTTDGLVTSGLYSVTRNPYFTSLLSLQFWITLVAPTAVTVFAFIVSALLLNLQVRMEEPFLEKTYGEAYRLYKSKTGRFMPGIL